MNISAIIPGFITAVSVTPLPHAIGFLLRKTGKSPGSIRKTENALGSLYLYAILCSVLYGLRYESARAFFLSGIFIAGWLSASVAYNAWQN